MSTVCFTQYDERNIMEHEHDLGMCQCDEYHDAIGTDDHGLKMNVPCPRPATAVWGGVPLCTECAESEV